MSTREKSVEAVVELVVAADEMRDCLDRLLASRGKRKTDQAAARAMLRWSRASRALVDLVDGLGTEASHA